MKGTRTMDRKETEHFHLARLKKAGEKFEISVDPDLALKYAHGEDVRIQDVLLSDEIFKDAKKGMCASEHQLEQLFKTTDVYKIADIILKEGEIQLTQEYREKLREQKKRQIIEHIHRNGIDARTNAPLPIERIENAIEQEHIKIEEHRTAEDQVKRIIKELQKVIPIKVEIKEIEIKFKPEHAGKGLPFLKRFATVAKNNWNNDGSLTCLVQVPAGMFDELIDKLNSFTHGDIETRIINK